MKRGLSKLEHQLLFHATGSPLNIFMFEILTANDREQCNFSLNVIFDLGRKY